MADTLIPNTDANTHQALQNCTYTAGASTFSIYCKPAGYSVVRLLMFDGTASSGVIYNITTGAFVSSSGSVVAHSSTLLADGWRRIAVTINAAAGAGNIGVRPVNDLNTDNFAGDGTSGIYIWGAQLEEGAFPTSYIPTTASTVTRTADSASMTGSNFSSWYNPNEGSLYCSGRSNVTSDSTLNVRAAIATLFESPQTGFSLGIRKDNSTIDSFARVSGVSISETNLPYVLGSSFKSLMTYSRTNLNLALDGSTSIGNPNPTSLQSNPIQLFLGNQVLGGSFTFNTYLNGHISQLTYYPTRLPNNILQNLTR
jgi:hypothetical protein